jgi:hypothetical protein
MDFRSSWVLALTAGVGLCLAAPARALTIDIDTWVTGTNLGPATVATLTLTQDGADVDFQLDNKVGNLGQSSNPFISKLRFSYDGTPTLTSANFTNFGGTQVVVAADFGIDPPGQDAGYDFFLELDYPTSNQGDRFFDGEFSTWTITEVQVSDFDDLVTGSGPPSLAMVHIQQLDDGSSTKYVGDGPNDAPEPNALVLVGLGLLLANVFHRRRRER